MVEILVNKITGAMAEIPQGGNLGIKGNELLTNPDCTTKQVTGEMAEHIRKKHCVWADDNIILLPEDEWAENIPYEEIEEEQI